MKLSFEYQAHLNIQPADWSSWTWQMKRSARNFEEFEKSVSLTDSETAAFDAGKKIFSVRSTPYYLSLLSESDRDPIRRILIPQIQEIDHGKQALLDPLGERDNNPTPRIIHRYPDRVLFLVTDFCSVYCRYCTRKHFTGQEQAFPKADEYQAALRYIESKKGIREVILSGGDPLTLSDELLERVLTDLRKIEHIEIIRIGSRMPVVCPMRMTPELVKILKAANPVYLMTHFNHPRELTGEARDGLALVADAGVPIFNQMVLLNGVNNHPAIVQALSRRLLYLRVKPYYMFQCDPSIGTDHLRTRVDESLEIQRELWGNLSGLAMPNLSLDIPAGGGKVGLVPNFQLAANAEELHFKGWDGKLGVYQNPDGGQRQVPIDAELYQKEWDELKSAKS